MTEKWQAGRLYPPGSIVEPRTSLPNIPTALQNPGFDAGTLDGWTIEYSAPGIASHAVNTYNPHSGSHNLQVQGVGNASTVEFTVLNDENPIAYEGTRITVRGWVRLSSKGIASATVVIVWLDEDGAEIRTDRGQVWSKRSSKTEVWRNPSVTGVAPAGTASVKVGFWGQLEANSDAGDIRFDALSWDYNSAAPPQGLMYRAVQPAAGYSDSSEPQWPVVLGEQVVDNEVIWEAISVTGVVWRARPIMVSGDTEPDWPSRVGERVTDNTIAWEALDQRVVDENNPQSKVVAIAEGKVFAGDGDIVRYSATLVPSDWTSPEDAGYIATGLRQGGANDVAVLNLYRGNLVVMNATGFQQWQIDPDPALMDLLDEMPGIGSIYQLAAQPVANDLFYLSNLGVRTIGISGATNNLAAGDVGLPIDPLIQEEMRIARETGEEPLSTYYPSAGQYWLIFNRTAGPDDQYPRSTCPQIAEGDRYALVYVYTLNQVGQVGAWSRYVFPFAIDDIAHEGNDLYVRNEDRVIRLSDQLPTSDQIGTGAGLHQPFESIIWFPWLDMGQPGRDKIMDAFDVVGYGYASVEFGYAQDQMQVFTDPVELDPDTLRGDPVMMPLTAPSFSVRLQYHGYAGPGAEDQRYSVERWGFNATGLYFI